MTKNFNIEKLYQIIFFLINPILGFISSLYYLLKTDKKLNILSISLSISLIFIYFPIMYDTSSNFYVSESLKVDSFFERNFYNNFIVYIQTNLYLEYMTVIFLLTTFILFIWFYVFDYYKKSTSDNKTMILLTIFVFSSIIYRNILDLNRFYFAISIIFILFFIVNIKKTNINIILELFILLLAIYIHSAVALIVIFYYLSKVKINRYLYLIYFFTMLFFTVFNELLLSSVIPYIVLIDESLADKMDIYTSSTSAWGNGGMRILLLLLRVVELPLILLLLSLAFYLLKKNKDSSESRFLLLFGPSIFPFIPYITFYERFSITFFLFCSFIVYKLILSYKKNLILYTILFLFLLRNLLINFGLYGMIFTSDYSNVLPDQDKKIQMISKLFYYPTPLLAWIENNGYSNFYIKKESLRGRN